MGDDGLIDLLGLAFGAGALVVSLATLYVTSFRPAQLELLHPEPVPGEPSPFEANVEPPAGAHVAFPIVVSNVGAQGAVVVASSVEVREPSANDQVWTHPSQVRAQRLGEGSLPLGIEAADVHVYSIAATLIAARVEPDELARRIARLETVTLDVRLDYWRARRFGRKRERRAARVLVTLDARRYRGRAASLWRDHKRPDLAEIATG
ncbi:MAG TPA: hypothetical protein VK992_03070 [Candidatus Caenarcaniphilales bacterium]|nr:hypothetical protein [Candidatus Caenarcaniphilales bacterium]